MQLSIPSRSGSARATLFCVPLLLAACTAAPDAPDAPAARGDALELAIACRHDAGLAVLDSAAQARGGASSSDELQRVILLRDAGRTMDAARVLRERNARDDVTVQDAVHSGTAVEEGLERIRSERAARTGNRFCR
ncbi:hypothetical protein [Salipiger mangrovisoli]|uniref:Lipoprotein n=1 Tax=Salipiger mangrovisoli TaxID=2865933 RepID=A0ABR9X8S5_9RHOB|nr:hypothetical protein [Salipiger mangrovisoli]MBE9639905.1 hypothetical protein [Salipiger mangrovisoli]